MVIKFTQQPIDLVLKILLRVHFLQFGKDIQMGSGNLKN
jgi:hypothetical protein